MAAVLTEVRQITGFLRDKFRAGLDISNPEKVDSAIKDFKAEFPDASAECLLFLVQKMNALALFNVFKENNNQQTYPIIPLLDPYEVLKRHGFKDIMDTVSQNFIARKLRFDSEKGKKAHLDISGYAELNKAAAANPAIAAEKERDMHVQHQLKFAQGKIKEDLDKLSKFYHERPMLNAHIKSSGMENDAANKLLLDFIRDNDVIHEGIKKAGLQDFIYFCNELNRIKPAYEAVR